VKKNPESQKFSGAPLSIHDCKNLSLSTKSLIYVPKGLREGYDT